MRRGRPPVDKKNETEEAGLNDDQKHDSPAALQKETQETEQQQTPTAEQKQARESFVNRSTAYEAPVRQEEAIAPVPREEKAALPYQEETVVTPGQGYAATERDDEAPEERETPGEKPDSARDFRENNGRPAYNKDLSRLEVMNLSVEFWKYYPMDMAF